MIFELIRKLTCNFEEIEKYIPKKGNVIDIGCGHGIFSKMLSEKSSHRKVLGIDPSPEKIKRAKKNTTGIKNLQFKNTYLDNINIKFDTAVVIDIIYLLPMKEKEVFLKNIAKILSKNGTLILVINGTEPYWMHKLLVLQEGIMHKMLKITFSDYDRTYFENKRETRFLLRNSGFRVLKIRNIKSILPYPHILFVAKIK
jgi:2-polyprenyl-6-hydroxyphenyl methylase/3-demethylubiquinone-9 3-methyltransferase